VAGRPQVLTEIRRAVRRPFWLSALIGYSLFLGIVTDFPQLYYLLVALQPHTFPTCPDARFLGQVWYSYILKMRQGRYLPADSGTFASAHEDTFMLGPLYTVTGMGRCLRRSWVVPIWIMTGAMIFCAVLYVFLCSVLVHQLSVAEFWADVASTVPYLAYPLWLIPVLLVRRSLFVRRQPAEWQVGARQP
jgi:hypothetical protein